MGGLIEAQHTAPCENICGKNFLPTTPTGEIGENFLLAKISVYAVLSSGHVNTIKLPGKGGDDSVYSGTSLFWTPLRCPH